MLHFFVFKQKTAYEMRISDWSSDVCSSDLWRFNALGKENIRGYVYKDGKASRVETVAVDVIYDDQYWQTGYTAEIVDEAGRTTSRSEERRVGKECVSTCRSRGST